MPRIRDWSLITGRGATKREGGGAREVLPLRKGGRGAEKVLAMLKGGTQIFGVVFTRQLEVLAILWGGGGPQKVPTL